MDRPVTLPSDHYRVSPSRASFRALWHKHVLGHRIKKQVGEWSVVWYCRIPGRGGARRCSFWFVSGGDV